MQTGKGLRATHPVKPVDIFIDGSCPFGAITGETGKSQIVKRVITAITCGNHVVDTCSFRRKGKVTIPAVPAMLDCQTSEHRTTALAMEDVTPFCHYTVLDAMCNGMALKFGRPPAEKGLLGL